MELIGIRCRPFHPSLGECKSVKAKLFIKAVGITRRQNPASEPLKIGVRNDHFHQPFAQTLSAKLIDYKNIAYVGKRRMVANHAGKTDLTFILINAETKRIFYRGSGLFGGTLFRPIGFLREKFVYHPDLQPRVVGAYLKFSVDLFFHSDFRKTALDISNH